MLALLYWRCLHRNIALWLGKERLSLTREILFIYLRTLDSWVLVRYALIWRYIPQKHSIYSVYNIICVPFWYITKGDDFCLKYALCVDFYVDQRNARHKMYISTTHINTLMLHVILVLTFYYIYLNFLLMFLFLYSPCYVTPLLNYSDASWFWDYLSILTNYVCVNLWNIILFSHPNFICGH